MDHLREFRTYFIGLYKTDHSVRNHMSLCVPFEIIHDVDEFDLMTNQIETQANNCAQWIIDNIKLPANKRIMNKFKKQMRDDIFAPFIDRWGSDVFAIKQVQ